MAMKARVGAISGAPEGTAPLARVARAMTAVRAGTGREVRIGDRAGILDLVRVAPAGLVVPEDQVDRAEVA